MNCCWIPHWSYHHKQISLHWREACKILQNQFCRSMLRAFFQVRKFLLRRWYTQMRIPVPAFRRRSRRYRFFKAGDKLFPALVWQINCLSIVCKIGFDICRTQEIQYRPIRNERSEYLHHIRSKGTMTALGSVHKSHESIKPMVSQNNVNGIIQHRIAIA